MKPSPVLLTALLFLGASPFCRAQTAAPAATPPPVAATPTPKPAAKQFAGKVTAIGNGSISVNNAKAGARTFKLAADAPVSKAGEGKTKFKPEDIKTDDMVRIKIGATEDTAEKVFVMPPKKDAPPKSEKKGQADKPAQPTPAVSPKP